MSNRARQSNRDLTDMQRVVVEELRRGRSWTKAAESAGYADPSGEVDRLKANPAIIDAVVGPLQERAAKWELLGEMARKVLERNMRDGHADWCRSLGTCDPEHGWAPCNCWFAKLKPADANAAAKITTSVLGRTDPETLADRAAKEDDALTDEAAAKRYLGSLGGPKKEEKVN